MNAPARPRVLCVDDEERMTRVEGMRDELPHHGAVLPEVADPVAARRVNGDQREDERGERRGAQSVRRESVRQICR